MFFLFFFLLGSIFGSFSTVLVERWHSGKRGIWTGRSECPKCGHTLAAMELVPILSYVFQRGHCKKCHTHISVFYPLVEISMGILFMLMAYALSLLWLSVFDGSFWLMMIATFITGVYMIYDLQYMEIPDQILVPGIYGIIILFILSYFFLIWGIFFDISSYPSVGSLIVDHSVAAVILYSFLFAQILIPGVWYLIQHKQSKHIIGLLGLYFTLPISMVFDFFGIHYTHDESELDIPTWVGGGDLRVALFIGLTLGSIHGIAAFFFAYGLGSIIGICLLVYQQLTQRKKISQIAFWPFLWAWWILSVLLYIPIEEYLKIFFI